jgi:hypothetical protein
MTSAGTKRRLQVGILQVGILQVGDFAGWNFARLPGTLQVDNANLKLHHFFIVFLSII